MSSRLVDIIVKEGDALAKAFPKAMDQVLSDIHARGVVAVEGDAIQKANRLAAKKRSLG